MSEQYPTYETVVGMALRLTPVERARLIAQIAPSLVEDQPPAPIRSLRGLLSGTAPSADEIDDARREMWGDFPREDI